MADDQSDHAALLQDLLDRVRVLETQAPLESSSIGSGGVRLYDGGSIVFDGGNTASDISIGVVGGQTQIRMGDAVIFEQSDHLVLVRSDSAGVIRSRVQLGLGAASMVAYDAAGASVSDVTMNEVGLRAKAFGKALILNEDSISLINVPDGTPDKSLGIMNDGRVVKYTGGTGPHPPQGTWVWSFPLSSVTSEFGPRDGRFHEGIDLGNAPALNGASIRSIGPGTVVESGWHSSAGFGNWVVINHGNRVISGTTYTLKSVYGHMLNTPPVSVGAAVTSSTVIGQVGNTGGSYGAHLHLETHLCAANGGSIIWRNYDPSWSSDRTAANPRTVMAALGATGG